MTTPDRARATRERVIEALRGAWASGWSSRWERLADAVLPIIAAARAEGEAAHLVFDPTLATVRVGWWSASGFDELDDLRGRIASETVRAEMAEERLAAVEAGRAEADALEQQRDNALATAFSALAQVAAVEAVRDHYIVLAGLPVHASDVADRLDAALGGGE